MTIAGGLALMIIGAILRYAVTWHAQWIDLRILGAILMIGGTVGLVAGVAATAWRRRTRQQEEAELRRRYDGPLR